MTRPVGQQVVVITGASSGIGRETALEFGRRGASVVLAARNGEALNELAREIERIGGQALAVVTDVAEYAQVEALANDSVERFERIDTWVNNAAVSEYATVEQMTADEMERIVRVNLLGAMYGCRAALPKMKHAGGGTIINVGSALSERAIPLQSAYVATKHGLKGFSDAFRLEQQAADSGITVTLVLPSSINTPFFDQARSKMGVKPAPVPPVYEPRAVADAIVFAAESPRREIVVGGAGKLLVAGEKVSGTLTDLYMVHGGRLFKQQQTDQPDDGQDNLFAPLPGPGSTTGRFGEGSRGGSLYTEWLELHPARKRLALFAALAAVLLFVRRAGR